LTSTIFLSRPALDFEPFPARDRRQGVVGVPGEKEIVRNQRSREARRIEFLFDSDFGVADRGHDRRRRWHAEVLGGDDRGKRQSGKESNAP
jgi:hypothetical protein